MKKRIISAVLAMILAIVMITPAFAIVQPSKAFYVADYAHVLKSDTEQEIIDANALLENTCDGAQIVVVTIDYLYGMYADEYALRVMNDWGVGSAKKNNGMVLVFAIEENKGWLATGDGIDEVFTDRMANKYLDKYFWKHYDNGNYDKAVSTLIPKLVEWYEDDYATAITKGPGLFTRMSNSMSSAIDYILHNETLMYIILIIILIIIQSISGSIRHYRAYYTHMGIPIPRFRIKYFWSGPHIGWVNPNPPVYDDNDYDGHHHHHYGGHGGYRSSGRSGGGFRSSGRGGGGRSGGGGGGRR